VQERKKLIENTRKSNFSIGENNKHQASNFISSNQQFQSLADNSSASQVQHKPDFKKANFNLGSSNFEYISTNKDNYKGNAPGTLPNQEAKQVLVNKQRTQNFSYGNDQPIYKSMAQNNYVEHDLSSIASNKQSSLQNGINLRKSNLLLGTDNQSAYNEAQFAHLKSPTPHKESTQDTVSARESSNKKKEVAGSKMQKNNFSISAGSHPQKINYTSVQQEAMKAINNPIPPAS
jgi:hypothetical protein